MRSITTGSNRAVDEVTGPYVIGNSWLVLYIARSRVLIYAACVLMKDGFNRRDVAVFYACSHSYVKEYTFYTCSNNMFFFRIKYFC